MGCLSTDRKVHMEPVFEVEEGEFSPSISPSRSFARYYDEKSGESTRAASSKSGRLFTRISSMDTIKPFAKLRSHSSYEQLKPQSTSSDTAHAGISLLHQNPLALIYGHHDGEVALHNNDPAARSSTPASVSASASAACREPVTDVARHTRRFTTSGNRDDCVSSSTTHNGAPISSSDSFDDEPQFKRRNSSSTVPGVGPALQEVTVCQGGRGGEYEAGIQHAGSYDVRKDLSEDSFNGEGDRNFTTKKVDKGKCNARVFEIRPIPEVDPPCKLIGAFLQRQSESGSNFLDLDMDMEELSPDGIQFKSSPRDRGRPPLAPKEGQRQSPSPSPSPSPKRTSAECSYTDLCGIDQPVTISTQLSFTSTGSPYSESFTGLNGSPKQDVAVNVLTDEVIVKSLEQDGTKPAYVGAFDGRPPRFGMIRSRKNPTFQQSPEEQVLKAPTQVAVKPSFTRLKSRLADLPKPPNPKVSGDENVNKTTTLKSGVVKPSGQLKSGVVNKKGEKEDEEEDPLNSSDLPEKFRKPDKGKWAIFQWLAFLCILAGLITVLAFGRLRSMKRGGLVIWKWVLIVLVVFCGRLISGWIIWVLVFIIEKNFLLRKKVVYFVYALRRGVQNCLWLGFALLAWHLMIDPKVDNKVVKYVTEVLVCFLVAAIVILVKTLIVKVFASSFHVSNYFERIQEALFNQYLMETLAGPPLLDFELEVNKLAEEKKLIDEITELKNAGASGPSLRSVPDLPPISVGKQSPPIGTFTGIGKQSMKVSGGIGRQSMKSSGPTLKSAGLASPANTMGRNPKAPEAKKKVGMQEELNEGISVAHLTKLDQSNISAWHMKRLVHIIKHSTLTHSIEETVNSVSMETESEIQSEWQAKSAAKQIFKNVARPGERVLTENDLLRFMPAEETKRAIPLFDGATEKKCITKQALKNWVINAYRERRALALSLNDTKTAVNKLHRIVDVVVGLIIIVVWLLLLGIATTKLLLFMSSQILLLILVWGNTLKTVFEAIIFLFVMHPFDVGDRCVVDGVQLVVEEMNILTTVFLGDFNVKIWYPNSVLATKPIQNYYRSPEMGDGVELIVQACTPVEKIASFKEKMGRYIASKANHWHQDFSLNVLQMTEGERMKLSLGLKHTMNYQDMGEIVKRRSELLSQVNCCLKELDIQYHLPAQEIHVRKVKD